MTSSPTTDTHRVRVVLPAPLRTLVGLPHRELELEVHGAVTQRSVLDTLEATHPALRGTIRDRGDGRRRAFIRFFACEEDLSHEDPDTPLPVQVVNGAEPYLVIGAMAGG